MQENLDPRYPIGRFAPPAEISETDRQNAMATLAELPDRLRASISGLAPAQIKTPYREGGWSVQQLVNHVADSHSIALFRVKKSLTEEWPTLPGYDEKEFAKLRDAIAPIEWSLKIIDGVHSRWLMLLQGLDDSQWKRGFTHAERGPMTLEFMTLNYAWHSLHHVAHINNLRQQHGW